MNKHITSQFYRPKVNSAYNGTESVSFLGLKIWEFLPNELKDIGNLAVFKKAIDKWSPEKCPCRLCKDCIRNAGFILKKEVHEEFFPFRKLVNTIVLTM